MHFILFYFTFSSFKVVEEPLPYLLPLHRDHCHSVHKRDDHTTPSTGMQAPCHRRILPLAPTPTTANAPFAGTQVMFFFFFFVPFLTNVTETLFTPCARSSKPHLSTHNPHHHALPLKPPKSPHHHCLHSWACK